MSETVRIASIGKALPLCKITQKKSLTLLFYFYKDELTARYLLEKLGFRLRLSDGFQQDYFAKPWKHVLSHSSFHSKEIMRNGCINDGDWGIVTVFEAGLSINSLLFHWE
jgi:hypothetical protein